MANHKLLVNKPYVEIGGVKWATMNIGAETETDYGLYFQWGDTAGYTSGQCGSNTAYHKKPFYLSDCVLHNGTTASAASAFTKYNGSDKKTVLEETDDAAVANWGGDWRMPTTAEYAALSAAVNTELTADYQGSGVAGMICTDKTDSSKKLFFPAAGYCYNGGLIYDGRYGRYWSSSLYTSNVSNAWYLEFDLSMSSVYWQHFNYGRFGGYSVRPVLDA